MLQSAILQLINDVAWNFLDYLIIDFPPGTGDTQLTIMQKLKIDHALIVTTPQEIALADTRKGINMFNSFNVPIAGIVENMSYFACPHCGERTDIFGHGGAREEADRLGVDFLGEIPLHLSIRETSDGGNPIVASDPDNAHSQAFRAIGDRIWDKLSGAGAGRAMPNIVMQ